MSFVVPVREQWRKNLAAITHVDGTARVQVMPKGHDPMLERLLVEFGDLTGGGVLFNTSFNNYAEPIVHTPYDALTCLLTTQLSCVAMGPYVVRLRAGGFDAWLATARVSLSPFCELVATWTRIVRRTVIRRVRIPARGAVEVSDALASVIASGSAIEGIRPSASDSMALGRELLNLWDRRLVRLTPEPVGETAVMAADSAPSQVGGHD